jgi:hypothetical protein
MDKIKRQNEIFDNLEAESRRMEISRSVDKAYFEYTGKVGTKRW